MLFFCNETRMVGLDVQSHQVSFISIIEHFSKTRTGKVKKLSIAYKGIGGDLALC